MLAATLVVTPANRRDEASTTRLLEQLQALVVVGACLPDKTRNHMLTAHHTDASPLPPEPPPHPYSPDTPTYPLNYVNTPV